MFLFLLQQIRYSHHFYIQKYHVVVSLSNKLTWHLFDLEVVIPRIIFKHKSLLIKHLVKRLKYKKKSSMILELCCQAGDIHAEEIYHNQQISHEDVRSISTEDLKYVGANVPMASEKVRARTDRCKEFTWDRPSGHKARPCGVFKYESYQGTHCLEKSSVNDLVPEKVVWHWRPQDPVVLVNEGINYYGHVTCLYYHEPL